MVSHFQYNKNPLYVLWSRFFMFNTIGFMVYKIVLHDFSLYLCCL